MVELFTYFTYTFGSVERHCMCVNFFDLNRAIVKDDKNHNFYNFLRANGIKKYYLSNYQEEDKIILEFINKTQILEFKLMFA